MSKDDDDYRTVRLPKELVDEIDKVVSQKSYGFASRAELVKEAVRLKLDEIKRVSALTG